VLLGDTKWGVRPDEMMTLVYSKCHGVPGFLDDMRKRQPIKSGKAQDTFVTTFYCRKLLIDMLLEYAGVDSADAYGDQATRVIRDINEGVHDKKIQAVEDVVRCKEVGAAGLEDVIRSGLFSSLVRKVGHHFKDPPQQTTRPKADLSKTCAFITADSTQASTWAKIDVLLHTNKFWVNDMRTHHLIMGSPPHGYLANSAPAGTKTKDNRHDIALAAVDIGRMAASIKSVVRTDAMCAFHLPSDSKMINQWKDAFEANGWIMMRHPLTFVETKTSRG
jgi:hypothetical protein